ncbi:hypothetical protein HYG77_09825 [Rhodococcus sp. ZPP]|uniref:hypothetical protein n=1 Tax=Rhodococcus sp. ZPP TaxID=2749906 RepID=UPI001AD851C0|nr:hypothetical protein [Rhodococcus sp. ZPP]QTJ65862.1 hypothetical protein HYG77_09825 [Rhodococcus sp. ZPP]
MALYNDGLPYTDGELPAGWPNPIQLGTKVQDASITPEAAEILPPTNAGIDDPHGPTVVAIEVDDPRRLAAIKAHRTATTDEEN